VQMDGHVEYEKTYYSVHAEHLIGKYRGGHMGAGGASTPSY